MLSTQLSCWCRSGLIWDAKLDNPHNGEGQRALVLVTRWCVDVLPAPKCSRMGANRCGPSLPAKLHQHHVATKGGGTHFLLPLVFMKQ